MNTDHTDAAAHFQSKLQFEIDVMDVADCLPSGGFMLVDTRRLASWEHGHIPGAVHIPTADIPSRAPELIPAGTPVVVYSWGPGCNGSTFAALALATLGYPVREMIGGIEYWGAERPSGPDDGRRQRQGSRLAGYCPSAVVPGAAAAVMSAAG
ncbi:rhodanese-like domain-containing protein [Arthrobacter sp. HS15c]|uniref:rhodanese-like domain-containing protein n=1 Tax=Arthrobacter sp. HS15c TaxID=3230279 RepID=UPI00346756E1